MAERYDAIPATFEVLDLKSFHKTEIDNTLKSTGKRKRIKKVEEKPVVSITEQTEIEEEESQIEPEIKPEPKASINPTLSVNFITPYTEIEVLASEVYADKTIFSVITPKNDRVKIRPKRGSELSAVYNGETYNLYASGVYIPITALDSVLSLFFVMDENQEEV